MPVNGDAVTNISGFQVLDCFQNDRNKKYTEGTSFYPLCAIKNETNVVVFVAHHIWLARRPTHMATCWYLPLTIRNP